MWPGHTVYLRNLLLPILTRGLAELLAGGGAAASCAPHHCPCPLLLEEPRLQRSGSLRGKAAPATWRGELGWLRTGTGEMQGVLSGNKVPSLPLTLPSGNRGQKQEKGSPCSLTAQERGCPVCNTPASGSTAPDCSAWHSHQDLTKTRGS